MKNQLSKREYKYRCKIITENHLKKEGQAYLGNYILTKGFTYKTLYLDSILLSQMLTNYSFWRMSRVMSSVGVSAKQATNAINRFTKRLTPYFKDGVDNG